MLALERQAWGHQRMLEGDGCRIPIRFRRDGQEINDDGEENLEADKKENPSVSGY